MTCTYPGIADPALACNARGHMSGLVAQGGALTCAFVWDASGSEAEVADTGRADRGAILFELGL
jgi:hypothetical protein